MGVLMSGLPALGDQRCDGVGSSSLVSVQDWTVISIDSRSVRIDQTLRYNGTEIVRVIRGEIRLFDPSGEAFGRLTIDWDATKARGETYELSGVWTLPGMRRLLDVDRKDVVALACVRAVIYADGSIEAFD